MTVSFDGVELRRGSCQIILGDCRQKLAKLPANSIDCCITSPPYFGLRDYQHPDQIGLEVTPAMFVDRLVAVFRLIRDALKDDGTVWVNVGDSYARIGSDGACGASARVGNTRSGQQRRNCTPPPGFKNKDLFGMPWRLALALQEDGWYLRSDIIWHKTNAMPESVTDRPTKAHEYLFLLSKSEKYYFDAYAIREQSSSVDFRNRRTVWSIPTKTFKGAHFATMPPDLVEPCVLAGTSAKGHCPNCGNRWRRIDGDWQRTCACETEPVPDVVLDPFGGSGTTALVARQHGRDAILIELNSEYANIASERLGLPMIDEPESDASHEGDLSFSDAPGDGVLQ